MAAFVRHVDVEWNGGLMDGNGTAKAGTGAFSVPVTFPSRINEKGDDKTTPEELLAASHAICYAMVLTNTISKQGGKARKVRVTATVTADKGDAGIKVALTGEGADEILGGYAHFRRDSLLYQLPRPPAALLRTKIGRAHV